MYDFENWRVGGKRFLPIFDENDITYYDILDKNGICYLNIYFGTITTRQYALFSYTFVQ